LLCKGFMKRHRRQTHIYLCLISAPEVGVGGCEREGEEVLNLSRKQYHKAKTLFPYFFNKLIRLGSFECEISTKVLGMVV
jgi:hypothetical protein